MMREKNNKTCNACMSIAIIVGGAWFLASSASKSHEIVEQHYRRRVQYMSEVTNSAQQKHHHDIQHGQQVFMENMQSYQQPVQIMCDSSVELDNNEDCRYAFGYSSQGQNYGGKEMIINSCMCDILISGYEVTKRYRDSMDSTHFEVEYPSASFHHGYDDFKKKILRCCKHYVAYPYDLSSLPSESEAYTSRVLTNDNDSDNDTDIIVV